MFISLSNQRRRAQPLYIKQDSLVWTALSLMGGLEKRRKALGVWHRIAEKFFTGRPLGNFSKRGWGRIQNVFGPAVRGTSTQNKKRREKTGGAEEMRGNMCGILSTGYGVQALVWVVPDWRLLPPTYHSSCTGSSLTGTGAFVSALQRSKSTVENPACWKKKNKWLNIARPCDHTWCRTELLPRQTANSSVWVDPHNDSKWPRPTHAPPQRGPDENQQGDYHLTRESRDEKLKTVNSDTLASQQHPLFLPQLSWAALQKEREKKKSWKIYSLSRSLSVSLSPSLSLSLLFPLSWIWLLNSAAKTECSWPGLNNDKEGRERDHTLRRKKNPPRFRIQP